MDNGINNPNINVPSLIKTYVSEDGLRTYHEQVKAALRKRALKSDLEAYLKKTEASETYVTKDELNDEIQIDPISDEEIDDICEI